jgi:HEAT repeat protein
MKDDIGYLEKVLRDSKSHVYHKMQAIKTLKDVDGGDKVLSRAYLEGSYTRGGIKHRGEPVRKVPGEPLDGELREAIIRILGNWSGKGEGAIWQALDDKSPRVRLEALRAVAHKEMDDAAGDIVSLLKDNPEEVMVEAARTLGDLKVRSDEIIKGLNTLLKRMEKEYVPGTGTRAGPGRLAIESLEALGKIGGAEAEKILRSYAGDEEKKIPQSEIEEFAMAAAKYLPAKAKSQKEEK